MKKMRIRRLMIVLVILVFCCAGIVWWRNARTTLRTVTLIHGNSLVDLAQAGLLIVDGEDIVHYDWNGRQQARYSVDSLSWGREPPGTGWGMQQEKWFNQWLAADVYAYCEHSRPERTFDCVRKLARFSPNGTYVGILAYQTGQLDVSVWRGQTLVWRMTIPLSPRGPVTGAVPVDLLVSESGHVILYTAGTEIIIYASGHPAKPLAEISDGKVRTTSVQPAFAALIQDYVHALAPRPVSWAHGYTPINGLRGQSANGRFIFVSREYAGVLDRYLLPLAEYSGRTHLEVLEYPGRKRGERWGLTKLYGDRWLISVPFPGRRDFKYGSTPFFSPDGRHLVIRNWYGHKFGICKLR